MLAGAAASASVPIVAMGLLERDGVLASIEGVAARALCARGGAVLVEAPAGMGKTALLKEVRSRAEVIVLAARGVDLEQEFPLGVVRQLLEPVLHRATQEQRDRWLSGSAAITEALLRGNAARAVEEGAAFNALYWALAAMTADSPLLVVVDDVHWCDVPSLRWIGFVLRRLESLRLGMVLAARPPDLAAPQRAYAVLHEDPHVETIALAPLAIPAITAIVRAELGPPDDTFVAACEEAGGGNPFLLGELLSAARERAVAPTTSNVDWVGSVASAGLQSAVLARLTALGGDAVAVARAMVVLGTGSAVSLVAAIAEIALDDAVAAAQTLQRADLLAAGGGLSFRHPLLRAAVRAGLSDVALSAGHLRAARVLQQRAAPAEQVAAHLMACERVGEVWACEVLEQAAARALARASPALAARLFERALQEPVGADRKALLQAEMGGALATAGDMRGIDALLCAARTAEDPAQAAALAVRLGIPMWTSGRSRELAAVLEDARTGLRSGHPELAFQIAAVRAQAAASGSGEDVRGAVESALGLVSNPGSDGMGSRLALALLAAAALYANRPRGDIAALARRALGDDAAHSRAVAAGFPLMPAVVSLHLAEDANASFEALARVEEGQRARGALAIGLSMTLAWRAVCHLRRGALLEAEADAQVALKTSPPEAFKRLRVIPTVVLASVQLECGFPARSLTMIDAQLQGNATGGGDVALLALARARALRALRRPREAADAALAVGAQAQACGLESAMLLWPADAAEALLDLGDAEHATRLAVRAVQLAERFGAPGPVGCAMRVLGLVEHDLEHLTTAERTLEMSTMRLEHARSMVELGAALRRDGRRAAAREQLARGMELAHLCAAHALAARAHEELRAAGARPRSVVRSGLEALTASELRAARLAAEGLTNREIAQHLFVTQKTIETQLRAAYRKLDVEGRRALGAALAS